LPKAGEVVRKIGHFLDHTLVFCGCIGPFRSTKTFLAALDLAASAVEFQLVTPRRHSGTAEAVFQVNFHSRTISASRAVFAHSIFIKLLKINKVSMVPGGGVEPPRYQVPADFEYPGGF